MKPMTIHQVAKAVKSKTRTNLVGDVLGVTTDSRKLEPGDLFIPLQGEKFDGHEFVFEAFEKGAAACFCSGKRYGELMPYLSGKNVIVVDDTKNALLSLAGYYRRKFAIPFIAVTGSVGKTSTKDIIAQVLGERFKVLKNPGSFNNEIGLPLTLLQLEDGHNVGIVEMGMRGIGEISKLSKVVSPNIAVITNVGISHIGRLGSKENIARAKLEVLESLDDGGISILNADSPELLDMSVSFHGTKFFFGIEQGDIKATDIISLGKRGTKFKISWKKDKASFTVPLPGIHSVYNTLPAIIVGHLFGLTAGQIQRGLEKLKPTKMRLEIKRSPAGVTVIDDSYNASPDSMKVALDYLETSGSCRAAILGDMLELGNYSQEAHFEIGNYAATKSDILLAIGDYAKTISDGAYAGGMTQKDIFVFDSVDKVLPIVKDTLSQCDSILVKASRGMKMERIVRRLMEGE